MGAGGEGWGQTIYFWSRCPGPASALGLGGVQFLGSIKALYSKPRMQAHFYLPPPPLHRWRRVRNAPRLSPKEPERGGLLSPDRAQRLLFSTLSGHGTGSPASLSPCFRGMGGEAVNAAELLLSGAASDRQLEKPRGLWRGRERPECSQGRPACALLLPGARTRPQKPETPSSAAAAPESVRRPPGTAREAHLAWSSAAAPWAGGGAGRGAPGLAVSLASARRAFAIRPGLAFAALTAQSAFFWRSSAKKWECHWNLFGLPSARPQPIAGREGGRLGPAPGAQQRPASPGPENTVRGRNLYPGHPIAPT